MFLNKRNHHDFKNHGDLKVILYILLSTIFLIPNLDGQVRRELEDRRQRLLNEIKITSNLLNKTTENKAAALSRYVTLQKQIQKREQLLEILRQEISFTNRSIERAAEVLSLIHI